MRSQMIAEDELRETLIKRSREVLKLSKNSIYSLHRGQVAVATAQVAQAKELAKRDLLPLIVSNPQLRHGALSAALEEYAEAAVFAGFLAHGRVPTMAEVEIVTKEEYLGGVMDFTGELNRYAVLRATARDIEAVRRCRDIVDGLFAQLMLFDWRNGQLRRKFDAVKYTVKKLEQSEWACRHSRGREAASPPCSVPHPSFRSYASYFLPLQSFTSSPWQRRGRASCPSPGIWSRRPQAALAATATVATERVGRVAARSRKATGAQGAAGAVAEAKGVASSTRRGGLGREP